MPSRDDKTSVSGIADINGKHSSFSTRRSHSQSRQWQSTTTFGEGNVSRRVIGMLRNCKMVSSELPVCAISKSSNSPEVEVAKKQLFVESAKARQTGSC